MERDELFFYRLPQGPLFQRTPLKSSQPHPSSWDKKFYGLRSLVFQEPCPFFQNMLQVPGSPGISCPNGLYPPGSSMKSPSENSTCQMQNTPPVCKSINSGGGKEMLCVCKWSLNIWAEVSTHMYMRLLKVQDVVHKKEKREASRSVFIFHHGTLRSPIILQTCL